MKVLAGFLCCFLFLPATGQDNLPSMVVEIPAGTNLKYEFDKDAGEFMLENIDGKPRSVDFLPYPGNYGYIEDTYMDVARGGDGDAMDILLIGATLQQGTRTPFIPIAILKLKDNGEIDDKIVAVPADPSLQVVHCQSLECLQNDYPAILEILKVWFTNYKGPGFITFEGWESETEAHEAIEKWKIK